MGKYWKAWGALVGAAVGVGVAHGVIPAGIDEQIRQLLDVTLPIIGAGVLTWRFPANTD